MFSAAVFHMVVKSGPHLFRVKNSYLFGYNASPKGICEICTLSAPSSVQVR